MLNSFETPHLIETSYSRLKSKITFQQYRENLAKAGISDGLQISMNAKYYYTFDNSLLFTESIGTLRKSFFTR